MVNVLVTNAKPLACTCAGCVKILSIKTANMVMMRKPDTCFMIRNPQLAKMLPMAYSDSSGPLILMQLPGTSIQPGKAPRHRLHRSRFDEALQFELSPHAQTG